MKIVPASGLDLPTLTALFNAGFTGYLVPMRLSEERFRDHLATNDIDLGLSTVVIDEEPIAFALAGRRGPRCWIGGMGTTPSRRRQGLGEKALVAAIEAAVARGCTEVTLEVLVDNEPAFRLYRKLGFQTTRDLVAWSLASTPRAPLTAAAVVEVDRAQAWISAHRHAPEPWQRADDTLGVYRRRGTRLRGLMLERDGEIAAAAILHDPSGLVSVLQIAAVDAGAAETILLAAAADGHSVRLANVPVDDPASLAFAALGAERVAVQHEMTFIAG